MQDPIKIRATLQGNVADVKVVMPHPMETGLRKDNKTGQLVPAHYIEEVNATWNEKKVMEARMTQGIAKNPFIWFKIKGAKAGDKVTINWVDNKGDKNSAEATIAPSNT